MPVAPKFNPAQSSEYVCRQLAVMAAHVLDNPDPAHADQVALQNIHRLLEMYRYERFVDIKPRGVLELGDKVEASDVRYSGGSLTQALDAAREAAFPGQGKNAVIAALESLVSAIARKAELTAGAATPAQAKAFFESVARNLRPA